MIIDVKVREPIVVEIEFVNVVRSDHDVALGIDDFVLGDCANVSTPTPGALGKSVPVELVKN
jgi:hypothetical protein